MITKLSLLQVHKTCAVCQTADVLNISALRVGVGSSPDVLAMPPCSTCGAVEFMQRQRVGDDPKHYDSEHCGAVNMLHRLALELGGISAQTVASAKAALLAEKTAARWSSLTPLRVFAAGVSLTDVHPYG